jgi:hypothetical protein|tara:strand:- start:838 stop:1155 length:318 start_codon:yes stop_codon:yes gene_type:complete
MKRRNRVSTEAKLRLVIRELNDRIKKHKVTIINLKKELRKNPEFIKNQEKYEDLADDFEPSQNRAKTKSLLPFKIPTTDIVLRDNAKANSTREEMKKEIDKDYGK